MVGSWRSRRPPRGPCRDGASAPRLGASISGRQWAHLADRPVSRAGSRRPTRARVRFDRGVPGGAHRRVLRSAAGSPARLLPAAARCDALRAPLRGGASRLRRGDDCSNWTRQPSGGATSRVSSRSAAGPIGSSSRSSRASSRAPTGPRTQPRPSSAPTASNDLRRLLDAGLITQQGRGPTTRYLASERLADAVRRRLETFD